MPSSWSGLPQAPNIIAPRQSGDTWTPVRPSGRRFIRPTLSGASRAWRARVISVTTDAARSASSCTWWLVQWRGWLSITHSVPSALPSASISGIPA